MKDVTADYYYKSFFNKPNLHIPNVLHNLIKKKKKKLNTNLLWFLMNIPSNLKEKRKKKKEKKEKKTYLNGDRGFGDLGTLELLSSLQI